MNLRVNVTPSKSSNLDFLKSLENHLSQQKKEGKISGYTVSTEADAPTVDFSLDVLFADLPDLEKGA